MIQFKTSKCQIRFQSFNVSIFIQIDDVQIPEYQYNNNNAITELCIGVLFGFGYSGIDKMQNAIHCIQTQKRIVVYFVYLDFFET